MYAYIYIYIYIHHISTYIYTRRYLQDIHVYAYDIYVHIKTICPRTKGCLSRTAAANAAAWNLKPFSLHRADIAGASVLFSFAALCTRSLACSQMKLHILSSRAWKQNLCMSKYTYIRTYTCTYTYVCIPYIFYSDIHACTHRTDFLCVYIYTYMLPYILRYIYIYLYIYIYINTHIHTLRQYSVHTGINMLCQYCVYRYQNTYVYICICMYIYICIFIYMSQLFCGMP